MKNAHFVRFQQWRRIPERMEVVLDAWREDFPLAEMTQNGFINSAVDFYIRKYERKLKIKRKRLDR